MQSVILIPFFLTDPFAIIVCLPLENVDTDQIIDRTLYVERMIGEEDKNAVLNWQKSGNLFVIATGRNLGTIKPIFESYGFSPDFWILNNGAMIADRDGKTLFTK